MATDIGDLTDDQLIGAASREGSDGPAFVELMRRYERPIWQTCYRLLGRSEDAADATQEVFVRLFLQRSQFEGRSKFSTWLHGIAVRTCLMLRRGRGRRERHESTAAEEFQRARQQQRLAGDDTELSLDLTQMLEILSEEDRAMLLMKYAQGHDYEALAAMFDLSVSACKMRISRARDKLKSQYPEHNFGG